MISRGKICLFLSGILVISQLLAAMHVTVHASEFSGPLHVHDASQFGFAPELADHEFKAHELAGHGSEKHESENHENAAEALSCLNYHMLLASPACLSGNTAIPGCTWLNLQKYESAAITAFFTIPAVPAIRGPPLSS